MPLKGKIVGVWLPDEGTEPLNVAPALVWAPGIEPFFIHDRELVDPKMRGRLKAFFHLQRGPDGSWVLGEEAPSQDWALPTASR